MPEITAVVDGHVHIHACYDIDEFFDQAHRNLSRALPAGTPAAGAFYLLLTETAGDHYFEALRRVARGTADPAPKQTDGSAVRLRRWSVAATSEDESVVASDGERRLILVAGRQVACKEGLEVLLLGTTGRFQDRRSIHEVLQEAAALGLPRVIPWGAGKWFFARAHLLSELLKSKRDPLFYLGDEGGRPAFWPYPRHFREAAALGVRDLPGTDPLPFPHDIEKVGRVGFAIKLDFDANAPARSLLNALRAGQPFTRFARLEPPGRFVRNQFAMQLRKRQSA
jgi:hypothetical protein